MENNLDPSLDLTLSQKFFLEKVKIDMERMTKADLQEYVIKLMELQYRKDRMWLTLLN
jgi:hypothetical protein